MKEPYKKGIANHLDPESCHFRRKTGMEALTGAPVGWVLSSEISLSGAPTFSKRRKATRSGSPTRDPVRPCGVEDPMHAGKLHAREPRGPMVARTPTGEGRQEKAMNDNPYVHGHGESDRSIVPSKSRNKGGRPLADGVEGRERTKENTVESNPHRTQRRANGSSRLDGVRQAALRDKRMKFTALLHHVNIDLLRDSYYSLKRKAAPGVDQLTWQEYGKDLEERLTDLHGQVHRGAYRAQPSRRVYIPKSDGRPRLLGIAALEDKIVQQAVRKVLEQIYEADFLGFSCGFRPGRSQHDALDALSAGIVWKKVNWILDSDVRGFLDTASYCPLVHETAPNRLG